MADEVGETGNQIRVRGADAALRRAAKGARGLAVVDVDGIETASVEELRRIVKRLLVRVWQLEQGEDLK